MVRTGRLRLLSRSKGNAVGFGYSSRCCVFQYESNNSCHCPFGMGRRCSGTSQKTCLASPARRTFFRMCICGGRSSRAACHLDGFCELSFITLYPSLPGSISQEYCGTYLFWHIKQTKQ